MPIRQIKPAPAASSLPREAEVQVTPRLRRRIVPVASAETPAPAANEQSLQTEPLPPPRRRRIVPVDPAQPPAPAASDEETEGTTPPEPKPKQQRGHARKDARGKYMPTADYKKGFCRAPPEHRFKVGNPGGPGRPKKQPVTFDEAFTRQAIRKMRVGVDGKPQKMSAMEAFVMRVMSDALGGKSTMSQRLVMEEMRRLFPGNAGPAQASPLSAGRMDEWVLRQFFAGMSLGEPAKGSFDPMADALGDPLTAGLVAGLAPDEGGWNASIEGQEDGEAGPGEKENRDEGDWDEGSWDEEDDNQGGPGDE